MAITINAEGVKRGDLFFVPLNQVVVDVKKNTRFAPPSEIELAALRQSLQKNGQMVPAEVLLNPDRTVRLIAGYQRYSMLAELNAADGGDRLLKCVLFKGNEEEAVLRSIEENLRRSNPTPMDDATNIRTLMDSYGKTVEDIAAIYQKSTAWVTAKRLPLLQLPKDMQMQVHLGLISVDAAVLLVKVAPEMRQEVLDDAKKLAPEPEPEPEPEDEDAAPEVADPAPPEPEVPGAPAPAPKAKDKKTAPAPAPKGKAKKDPPKGKAKDKGVSGTQILKAARNKAGALDPDAVPSRKLKEVKDFLQEVVDTEIAGEPIPLLCIGFLQYIAGELTDAQMSNRLEKYVKTKRQLG